MIDSIKPLSWIKTKICHLQNWNEVKSYVCTHLFVSCGQKQHINYGRFNLASNGARFQRNHAGYKENHLDKNGSKLCQPRKIGIYRCMGFS